MINMQKTIKVCRNWLGAKRRANATPKGDEIRPAAITGTDKGRDNAPIV